VDGLIDTAPCGILLADDASLILDANRTLADALGYSLEALRGKEVRTVLARGARIYYQTHVFPLLRLRGEVHEIYLSLRTAGEEDLPVLLNAVRREHDDGPITEIAVVPIERRSRFEDEILEARRAAETASQSRARFLSMLSHDIRSPLSAIAFSADLLARGAFGPVTEAQTRELGQIASAGRYVLRLVSDVLEFSRLETGRVDVCPVRVDVAEAADAALALVAGQADGAGVRLERPDAPALTAWADRDRLLQILVNLLGNAIKFTGAGGRVTVTWSASPDHVAVHVEDTGPGIAPDRQAAVFAPFVQDDAAPADGSVGLGLAISRELARAMGGDLTVESAPGEGATFTVALPHPPAA
jgi:PAS domain S-box-containing protein